MAQTHSSIATDSERELRELIGGDATATMEANPAFVDAGTAAAASSQNIAVQRDTDDTADSSEEEDEDEDDEEDEEDAEEDDAEEAESLVLSGSACSRLGSAGAVTRADGANRRAG
jgi:hypothetical protein